VSPLRRLARYLWPHRWRVGFGLGCLLVSQPLGLVAPLFWMFIVDEVIMGQAPPLLALAGGSRPALLAGTVGTMFLVSGAGIWIGAVRGLVLGVAAERVGLELRRDLYDRYQAHGMRFFHDRRSGDLVARITGDVDTVRGFVTHGIDEVLANVLQIVWVLALVVGFISWEIGVWLLVPMVAILLMMRCFNRLIRPLYRQGRAQLGEVSAKIQENVGAMAVIKAFGREGAEGRAVAACSEGYFASMVRAIRARTKVMPFVEMAGSLTGVVMLGVGGWLVLRDYGRPEPALTVGGLLALRGYAWPVMQPVRSLARINDQYQRALAAADRVFHAMDEPLEIVDPPGARVLERARGRVSFDRVRFGYRADHAPVLEEVSIEVPAGRALGVVGPSGAGKSTLLALLMRFYDVQAGAVRVDGHDVRELDQQSLRRQMGVVTQEPVLFSGTVEENIGFGRREAGEAAVVQAAERAHAHGFIEALPEGYQTVVGERGVKLSGGQRQRICIARAFLADPRLMLLDEATSSVEPEAEAVIQRALEALMRDRTSLVVSHRLSMVRHCHQIITIRNGGIAERGTHESLMEAGGWYARMYRLQTQAS